MQKKKRIPKSKDELKVQMAHLQKIERMKRLARLVWPKIIDLKTIYDAQTALNAASGFIKQDLAIKTDNILVNDLTITLKEKQSAVKTAVEELIELLGTESASEAANLMEKMANSLGQYGASQFMKNPVKDIDINDFIA